MAEEQTCRAFAPGSIGNLACGFDVLGLALEGPGDEVLARRTEEPGVKIAEIRGDGGRLPMEPGRNTAGAAAEAALAALGVDWGVELELKKGLPLAAGMGGSAASAVAAVLAVQGLSRRALESDALLRCALAGESVASGHGHPDNAAPSLFGGLVLVPAWEPLHPILVPVPEELSAAHVRPHLEIETRGAREVLGRTVLLEDAVAQWGNTAALMVGLLREDWEVIRHALQDRVAEPLRAPSVPGFEKVRRAGLEAGALGISLSGSGPSLFALCRGLKSAEAAGLAMVQAFQDVADLEADLTLSPGRSPGARVVSG